MDVKSKEYQEHVVFKDLDVYMEFYEHLSDMVFSFISSGTGGMLNIDTYVFMSMKGSLESIQVI